MKNIATSAPIAPQAPVSLPTQPVKKAPFVALDHTTIDRLLPLVGPRAFAVYVVLLRHRNALTGLCCPSIETLAIETKQSVSSVKRALDDLKAHGVCDVTPRNDAPNAKGKARQTSNLFELPSPTKWNCPPVQKEPLTRKTEKNQKKKQQTAHAQKSAQAPKLQTPVAVVSDSQSFVSPDTSDTQTLLIAQGVAPSVAASLAAQYPAERIEAQIAALPSRKCDDAVRMLVASIKNNYATPQSAQTPEETPTPRKAPKTPDEVAQLEAARAQIAALAVAMLNELQKRGYDCALASGTPSVTYLKEREPRAWALAIRQYEAQKPI